MSEENIIRRKSSEYHRGKTDWARVDAMTEEEIEANALADPDNPPLTEAELERMLPMLPSGMVCLRLDGEVVKWIMAQRVSPHELVNAILREHIAAQQGGRKAAKAKRSG